MIVVHQLCGRPDTREPPHTCRPSAESATPRIRGDWLACRRHQLRLQHSTEWQL